MSSYQFIIDGMIWSFSRVKCYENCPKEFFMVYVEPHKKINNAFAEYGVFCHGLLEDYYKGKTELFELPDRYVNEYKNNVKTKFPKQFKTDLNKVYYDAGKTYFDNFDDDFRDYEVLGVEEKIDILICGYRFIGYIDLILRDPDGNIIIVDHKSKSGFSSKREKQEYLRQLYLYSLYVHEKYGQYPTKLCFNMFRANKLEEALFNEAELQETLQWFTTTIQKICEDEEFEDKIAHAYRIRSKDLDTYQRDDFYCCNLCNVRHLCNRSKQRKAPRRGRA